MTSYLSRFNYQLNGPESGRKWVFLHGLMGYGSNWRKIVSALEATERILTFDQRGHGRSWKPLTGYTSVDYAEDLFLITEELGWDRFFLVGHSMGGRNALAFAAKYPEKVEKLVIEDIGPDSNLTAVDYYSHMLGTVPVPFKTKLEAKEFMLNEWPKKGIVHESVLVLAHYLYSNLEEKEDGSVDWRFSKDAIIESVRAGRVHDAWDKLKSLSVPTLVIRGVNSKELSIQTFQKMLAVNLLIKGVEVSNAGHWVHADQPKEFARLISEFSNSP